MLYGLLSEDKEPRPPDDDVIKASVVTAPDAACLLRSYLLLNTSNFIFCECKSIERVDGYLL